VILDDPFVAPRHAQIEPVADGRFRISDLQSVNGLSLLPSAERVVEAQIGPDDVVRIGQTQIRIRPASYAVRPELVLRAAAVHRRPLGFALMAAALLALVLWSAWIATVSRDERTVLVFLALGVFVVVGVWIAMWSLVGRTTSGRENFSAHGFVACAGLAAIVVADALADYLSFGFDAGWLEYAGVAAIGAIFAAMIYRHLRLNSRATKRSLGAASLIASLAVCGAFAGMQMASDSLREGRMRYDATIKAPAFLWVKGDATAAFLARAGNLRSKADALARVAD